MVATTGNAPVFSALQADANLSQLSSLLKLMACGGYTREPHATCITNPNALFSILYITVSFRFTSHSAISWAVLVIPRHEPF